MKEIPLTQGQIALVDDEDYLLLSKFKWYAGNEGKTFSVRHRGTDKKDIFIHRMIMNPPKDKEVDHINGNGLDNRRQNLRIVTHRQNIQNWHGKKTSKYPGVSWYKRDSKWRVEIRIAGKKRHLGMYEIESEAATVYRVACAVLYPEGPVIV